MAGLEDVFRSPSVFGPIAPSTVWGALQPQSAAEWQHHRPDLRTFLPGFQGGRDLAQGIGEGNLGLGAWGALQLAGAALPFLGRGPRPAAPPAPSPSAGWQPPTGRVRPGVGGDQVEDVLRMSGVTDIRRHLARDTGTEYISFMPPHGLPDNMLRPLVRIPRDSHGGHPGQQLPGNFFDTAAVRPRDGRSLIRNAGGDRYRDWEALLAALRWRTSRDPRGGNWLVREDQAPRIPPPRPEPTAPPSAPDPRQLRLLGTAGAAAALTGQREQPDPLDGWRRGRAASISIGN
jgi:hypothetical protein